MMGRVKKADGKENTIFQDRCANCLAIILLNQQWAEVADQHEDQTEGEF